MSSAPRMTHESVISRSNLDTANLKVYLGKLRSQTDRDFVNRMHIRLLTSVIMYGCRYPDGSPESCFCEECIKLIKQSHTSHRIDFDVNMLGATISFNLSDEQYAPDLPAESPLISGSLLQKISQAFRLSLDVISDKDGMNVLHLAVLRRQCSLDFLKSLIAIGMDVHKKCNMGTPLDLSNWRNIDCVEKAIVLMEAGAKVENTLNRNKFNYNQDLFSDENKHKNIIEFLEHMKKDVSNPLELQRIKQMIEVLKNRDAIYAANQVVESDDYIVASRNSMNTGL